MKIWADSPASSDSRPATRLATRQSPVAIAIRAYRAYPSTVYRLLGPATIGPLSCVHSRSGQGQGRRSRQGQGRRSGQGVHSFDRDRDRDGDRDRDRDKECAQSIGTETGTPLCCCPDRCPERNSKYLNFDRDSDQDMLLFRPYFILKLSTCHSNIL